jgi:hypothetical protein
LASEDAVSVLINETFFLRLSDSLKLTKRCSSSVRIPLPGSPKDHQEHFLYIDEIGATWVLANQLIPSASLAQ